MRFPKHKKIVSRRPDDDLFVRFIAYCGVYLRLQVAIIVADAESRSSQWFTDSVMQFVRGLQSIHYTGLSRCTLLAERQPLASLWLAAAISTNRSAQQRLCSAAAAASYDVITARASVLGSTQTDIPRCNLSKLIFITASEQKRWKMFMELWMIIIERTNKQSVNCCRFLDWPYAALDRRLPR